MFIVPGLAGSLCDKAAELCQTLCSEIFQLCSSGVYLGSVSDASIVHVRRPFAESISRPRLVCIKSRVHLT